MRTNYRGEIKQAWIEDNKLHIAFTWLARWENYQWFAVEPIEYTLTLIDLFTHQVAGYDSIVCHSFPTGDMLMLFPANNDLHYLDPTTILPGKGESRG